MYFLNIFKRCYFKENNELGLKIDGKYLSNLRFTDDDVLIGKTKEELQEMIGEPTEESFKKMGYSVIWEKLS